MAYEATRITEAELGACALKAENARRRRVNLTIIGEAEARKWVSDYAEDVPRLATEVHAERQRAENWRSLYVDACDGYLGLGAAAEKEADKAYRNAYGEDGE